ncbi:MAG TPA: response regulator [Polyangiaceae bacterium]|nr:response regulator [Polyangiaceae bacterium]
MKPEACFDSGPRTGTLLRVLILDDDGLLGPALARLISRWGYAVRWTSSAAEAQSAARRAAFDCGVFDIDLGEEDDGVRVAERLLSEGGIGAVVFFSATCSEHDRRRASRVGEVVSKQKPEALRDAIRSAQTRFPV